MRLPLRSYWFPNPYTGLREHMEKVKENAWKFQHAIECQATATCGKQFEMITAEMDVLADEVDAIFLNVSENVAKSIWAPADASVLLHCLRVQEAIMICLRTALNWFTYREDRIIPESTQKDLFLLVDSVMEPIEELTRLMGSMERSYHSFSQKPFVKIIERLEQIRRREKEAAIAEERLKRKAFATLDDPVSVFRMFRLAENIGEIARQAALGSDFIRLLIKN